MRTTSTSRMRAIAVPDRLVPVLGIAAGLIATRNAESVLLVGAVAWLVRRTAGTARTVRVAAVVSVLGSAYGVYEHVLANLRAGPVDPRYAEVWESMSGAAQLWAATSGAVGPSPVLVPGTMGLAGVLLWLAVLRWRHGAA